ncbi:MAG: DUF6941 family protein [Vulcanimicrobiota bacterium]
MEVELLNVIFCDAVIPLPSNKLVCYGIFNEVTGEKFPLTYPHFSVMCAWSHGTGFHIQQLKLLSPNHSMIVTQSQEQYFTLEDETETAYVTTDVNQIVFTEPGTYYLQVFLDQKLVDEFPVHFRKSGEKPAEEKTEEK